MSFSYRPIRVFAIVLLLAIFPMAAPAQDIVYPSLKLGVYQQQFQEGTLTLDDQANEKTEKGTLIGYVFFVEKVIYDVFAVGVKSGSSLARTINYEIGTSDVTVEESAAYTALEFKTYSDNHRKNGFKAFLSVSYGTLTTQSEITTQPSAGSASTDTTGATIPIRAWSVGFDYILGFMVARLEAGQANGNRSDLEGGSTYRATYNYDSTTAAFALGILF